LDETKGGHHDHRSRSVQTPSTHFSREGKYYVLSEDGATAGGVYLWKSRSDAERLYTKDWENFVRDKYGAPPSVMYFESPVLVDNISHEILSDQ
jgi:hypothetical protein